MSDAKVKSFLPLPPMPPSSDDESTKKSPVPTRDKVAVYASLAVGQPPSSVGGATGVGGSTISPVPAHKGIQAAYGQLLTPLPGRLTPTGHGRIKAPPVGATSLRRVASTIDEFNTAGVCFAPDEAERCAGLALALDSKRGGCGQEGYSDDETPLDIAKCDPDFSWRGAAPSERQPAAAAAGTGGERQQQYHHASSGSTVITASSASSCGRSAMGSEIAVVASRAVKRDPPLEVVRTDDAGAVTSEDELHAVVGAADGAIGSTEAPATVQRLAAVLPKQPSAASLSASFTSNLVKGNSSRQGRSRQRWLVHSPTEELVRQVAGTVPITRDGRIVLVSASRKTEWILPKGGWDTDETREECAARETFEEAGLLGRLGGCLGPIDYETSKAKKRRLSQISGGEAVVKDKGPGGEKKSDAGDDAEGRKSEAFEGMRPPLPKRAKTEVSAATTSPTGPELTSASTTIKETRSSDSACTTASFDPKNYSYVRLSLFPLYVSSVKSDWPEKGRLRKLVDIDEAIRIMEAEDRPYFRRGLEMVKERGLHLLMKKS